MSADELRKVSAICMVVVTLAVVFFVFDKSRHDGGIMDDTHDLAVSGRVISGRSHNNVILGIAGHP